MNDAEVTLKISPKNAKLFLICAVGFVGLAIINGVQEKFLLLVVQSLAAVVMLIQWRWSETTAFLAVKYGEVSCKPGLLRSKIGAPITDCRLILGPKRQLLQVHIGKRKRHILGGSTFTPESIQEFIDATDIAHQSADGRAQKKMLIALIVTACLLPILIGVIVFVILINQPQPKGLLVQLQDDIERAQALMRGEEVEPQDPYLRWQKRRQQMRASNDISWKYSLANEKTVVHLEKAIVRRNDFDEINGIKHIHRDVINAFAEALVEERASPALLEQLLAKPEWSGDRSHAVEDYPYLWDNHLFDPVDPTMTAFQPTKGFEWLESHGWIQHGDDSNLLHERIKYNYLTGLDEALAAGVYDPNKIQSNGRTPLLEVLTSDRVNKLDALSLLLENGADPNLPFAGSYTEFFYNPLYMTTMGTDKEPFLLMLKHGGDLASLEEKLAERGWQPDWVTTAQQERQTGAAATSAAATSAAATNTPSER